MKKIFVTLASIILCFTCIAQRPYLVKDINPTINYSTSSTPSNSINVNAVELQKTNSHAHIKIICPYNHPFKY